MMRRWRSALAPVLSILAAAALQGAEPVKSLRLYVFDAGMLKIADTKSFQLAKEEVAATDLAVVCYLIVHPKGTLIWDTGVIPDSAFTQDGGAVTEGAATATKPLKAQLAEIGYSPADITYLGLSHYHFDHTANANEFAGATWLVREPERDAMFSDKQNRLAQSASYSALRNSKTVLLKANDYDVFGDGTVVIKAAPGHTPGHQVLYLKLPKTGPILLAGDLYHYPEERKLNRVPAFDFDKDQTLASRAAVEEFVKKNGAQLWIEHDLAANAKIRKSPAFYD